MKSQVPAGFYLFIQ